MYCQIWQVTHLVKRRLICGFAMKQVPSPSVFTSFSKASQLAPGREVCLRLVPWDQLGRVLGMVGRGLGCLSPWTNHLCFLHCALPHLLECSINASVWKRLGRTTLD